MIEILNWCAVSPTRVLAFCLVLLCAGAAVRR